jgi:hypothetical protein
LSEIFSKDFTFKVRRQEYNRIAAKAASELYHVKQQKFICVALATGSLENREFSSQGHVRHAPLGAAWRASCEGRFAVPRVRVR